jgi:hypothetical protein
MFPARSRRFHCVLGASPDTVTSTDQFLRFHHTLSRKLRRHPAPSDIASRAWGVVFFAGGRRPAPAPRAPAASGSRSEELSTGFVFAVISVTFVAVIYRKSYLTRCDKLSTFQTARKPGGTWRGISGQIRAASVWFGVKLPLKPGQFRITSGLRLAARSGVGGWRRRADTPAPSGPERAPSSRRILRGARRSLFSPRAATTPN